MVRFEWSFKNRLAANLPAALVDELYNALRMHAYEGGYTDRMFLPIFDEIVARHGWEYQGTSPERCRLIYSQVLAAFYRHRQHSQLTTAEALDIFPYWRLRVMANTQSAPASTWGGFHDQIVPADCEWIRAYLHISGSHHGEIEPLTRTVLKRSNDSVIQPPTISYYQALDPVTGQVVDTPKGISPGFHKDIRLPVADYVHHFLQLGMILPV